MGFLEGTRVFHLLFQETRNVQGTLFSTSTSTLPHRASRYKFQQDGAPVHRSRSTRAWLNANHVRLFNADNRPPCSPDMNPIEHLWPLVTFMLRGKTFANRDELWNALVVAFGSITPSQVLNLYNSMPSRLMCLKVARGGYTRY